MRNSFKLKLSKHRLTLFKRRMLMPLELQLKPPEQKPSLLPMPKKLLKQRPKQKPPPSLSKRTFNKLSMISLRNKKKRKRGKKKREELLEKRKRKRDLRELDFGMRNKPNKERSSQRR